jgi:hypothetical protein
MKQEAKKVGGLKGLAYAQQLKTNLATRCHLQCLSQQMVPTLSQQHGANKKTIFF